MRSARGDPLIASVQGVQSFAKTLHQTLSHLAVQFNYPAILQALNKRVVK